MIPSASVKNRRYTFEKQSCEPRCAITDHAVENEILKVRAASLSRIPHITLWQLQDFRCVFYSTAWISATSMVLGLSTNVWTILEACRP